MRWKKFSGINKETIETTLNVVRLIATIAVAGYYSSDANGQAPIFVRIEKVLFVLIRLPRQASTKSIFYNDQIAAIKAACLLCLSHGVRLALLHNMKEWAEHLENGLWDNVVWDDQIHRLGLSEEESKGQWRHQLIDRKGDTFIIVKRCYSYTPMKV